MPDDHTLLLSYARSRNAEAFAELVKRYSAFVFSVAKRVTGNTATAEDVTQDCFFALARHAISIRGSLPSWLHRVALNRSLQVTRSEARRQRHEDRVLLSSDADNESNWNQIVPLVDAALAKLPDELREPVVQHFLLGRTQAQVAINLHINQSTVSRRLQEGIERLRKHLKQTGVVCAAAALSMALAKNACAAVPVKLSISLVKMALAGPAAVTAAASTATVASQGVLSLPLIKGALILMALHSTKTAIVIGVGVLLTATTATVIYQNRPYPWQVESINRRMLDQVPPQVKVVPTRFPSIHGAIGSNDRFLGLGYSVDELIAIAYNASACRTVFETKLPEDHYDFIANLPKGNREALRQEIEKQFHLTAKTEKRKTDVLFLTVKHRNAPGLKPSTKKSTSSNSNVGQDYYHGVNVSLSPFNKFLEDYFEIPVIDRTRLAGRFDIRIKWEESDQQRRNPDALKKVLLNELGLELVPGREMIEILVVEEKH